MRRPKTILLLVFAVFVAGLFGIGWKMREASNGGEPSETERALHSTSAERNTAKQVSTGRERRAPPSTTAQTESSDAGSTDGGDSTSRLAQRHPHNAEWLKKNAAQAEKAVDFFCEENRRLENAFPVPPTHGSNDAAEFMASRVDWEGGVVSNGSLHLPEALRSRLKAAGTSWPAQLTAADLSGLDFSWMQQLLSYDSWDVARYGPWTDNRVTDFANAPIPNYVSLMEWSKLRFVQAFVDGDFASADAQVRHLAALIQSNGLLIADAIAAALITRVVGPARDAALAAGRDVSGWPEADVNGAARMRRVVMSGSSFFAPGVSDAVMKKAHDCLAYPCSSLVEGLGMQRSVEPADGQDPGVIDRYAREAGCSTRLLDVVNRTRPQTGEREFDFSDAPGVSAIYPDGGVP